MALNKIKKRINVVKTTSKITNAMKLMASAKLQKHKQHFAQVKDYYIQYYKTISTMLNADACKGPTNHTLHIVFTSHLGLCGGYNMNIVKLVKPQIRTQDYVLQIGKRGSEILAANLDSQQILTYEMNITDKIEYSACQSLSYYLLALLETQKIDSIQLHYTKFINAISFEPTKLSLIPFDEKFIKTQASKINLNDVDFEPQLSDILNELKLSYLSTVLYASMIETTISENASRRNAMDSATENAKELSEKLILKYNRERQTKITNEITEIIAGSDVKE